VTQTCHTNRRAVPLVMVHGCNATVRTVSKSDAADSTLLRFSIAAAFVSTFLSQILYVSAGYYEIRDSGGGYLTLRYEYVSGSGFGYLMLIGIMFFVLAVVLAVRMRLMRRLPRWIQVVLVLVCCTVAFHMACDFSGTLVEELAKACAPTSPAILLIVLGIIPGCDPTIWRTLRRVAQIIAVSASVLGIYAAAQVPQNVPIYTSIPATVYMVTSFWTTAYLMLTNPARSTRWSVLYFFQCASCLYLAIVFAYRSWILLVGVLVITDYFLRTSGRAQSRRRSYLIGVIIVICIGMIIIELKNPLWNRASDSRLYAKGISDTRTEQYRSFFEQVKPASLLLGRGPNAVYETPDASEYLFIDNQYIYLIWKFGILALIGYTSLVLWPGALTVRTKRNPLLRGEGVLVCLWIMALGGVSVYNAIIHSPANYLMVLLAGKHLSILSKRTLKGHYGMCGYNRQLHLHRKCSMLSCGDMHCRTEVRQCTMKQTKRHPWLDLRSHRT